jgi:hypothetical protein
MNDEQAVDGWWWVCACCHVGLGWLLVMYGGSRGQGKWVGLGVASIAMVVLECVAVEWGALYTLCVLIGVLNRCVYASAKTRATIGVGGVMVAHLVLRVGTVSILAGMAVVPILVHI